MLYISLLFSHVICACFWFICSTLFYMLLIMRIGDCRWQRERTSHFAFHFLYHVPCSFLSAILISLSRLLNHPLLTLIFIPEVLWRTWLNDKFLRCGARRTGKSCYKFIPLSSSSLWNIFPCLQSSTPRTIHRFSSSLSCFHHRFSSSLVSSKSPF